MDWMQLLTLLLIGLGVSWAIMTLFWVYYLKSKDPSVVDLGWTVITGILPFVYFYFSDTTAFRQHVVIVFSLIWGAKLALILIDRYKRGMTDMRYVNLTESWKDGLAFKYLIFFYFQMVAAVFLTIPHAIVMADAGPEWSTLDTVATVWFIASFLFQSSADLTLRNFKADPSNKGKVCDVGLWKYSRHPNYFFEWNIWISYSVFALAFDFGWIGLISPALMLFFLLVVTGIPPAEEQALKSKGDLYRDYMKRTSPFIPWFPKQ